MDYFNRKRNVQEPTGEPYSLAFTQTEVLERGWTVSMVRRHLGQPNAVLHCPLTYHYDRRRVYAAEATPAVQFDLLATEDVRLLGPRWLDRYAAYIPNILKASLLTRAENSEKPEEVAFYRKLASQLPPARANNRPQATTAPRPAPPPPRPAPPPPCPAPTHHSGLSAPRSAPVVALPTAMFAT